MREPRTVSYIRSYLDNGLEINFKSKFPFFTIISCRNFLSVRYYGYLIIKRKKFLTKIFYEIMFMKLYCIDVLYIGKKVGFEFSKDIR